GNVSIEVASGKPKTLEVTISDTGRGIEPNRLEQVFDRFYQEEGDRGRSARGTGLGVGICRQIVNGWGGGILGETRGKKKGRQFLFSFSIFKNKNNNKPPKNPPKKKKKNIVKEKSLAERKPQFLILGGKKETVFNFPATIPISSIIFTDYPLGSVSLILNC
ncbi:ATP-binding protein, partial [Microcystis aeruginosa]|uniref:ATP-binding protein n=1 Tax=Microcystis aeruginosa TaxID=1126 RepID=UPI000567D89E